MEACRNRLKEAEKNVETAALYGQQLLEENLKLKSEIELLNLEHIRQVERLQQDNYSLCQKLDSKTKAEVVLSEEFENYKNEHVKKFEKTCQGYESEILEKLKEANAKIAEAEKPYEDALLAVEQKEEIIKELNRQLEDANIPHLGSNQSLCDSFNAHHLELQTEKDNILKESTSLKCEVQTLQKKVGLKEKEMVELRQEILAISEDLEQKECMVTSYFNKVEKKNERIQELEMEIENLKYDETNPSRKGNSLFSEIEDHRLLLERENASLRSDNTALKKLCEMYKQQINKQKFQIASLISLSSCKSDKEYQLYLEESLASIRAQLNDSLKSNNELQSQMQNMKKQDVPTMIEKSSTGLTGWLQQQYDSNQNKINNLEEKIQSIQVEKVLLTDHNIELKRKLHSAELAKLTCESHIMRLKARLDNELLKKGEMTNSEREYKRIFEKIPLHEKSLTEKLPLSSVTPLETSKETSSIKILSSNDSVFIDPVDVLRQKSSKDSEIENNENEVSNVKKSVHLSDAVEVKDDRGEVNHVKMKCQDTGSLPKRKPRRVMEAPVITVSNENATECKQQ